MERWRAPATVVALEDDPSRVYHDGNVYRRQVDVTFDEPTLARMRLGYLCLRCMEPQEESMPGACSLCGYSMRDLQLQDLAAEFEGMKQLGPSTSIDDEIARIREERAGSKLWTPDAA